MKIRDGKGEQIKREKEIVFGFMNFSRLAAKRLTAENVIHPRYVSFCQRKSALCVRAVSLSSSVTDEDSAFRLLS